MKTRRTTTLSAEGRTIARLVESGGMLFSSGILGQDVTSGARVPEPKQQIETAFLNLRQLLKRSGAGLDDIGFLSASIADSGHVPYVEMAFDGVFRNRARPAFKINEYPLPKNAAVDLQILGVRGEARHPVEISGLGARQRAGVRMGQLVFSSPIDGTDPATGRRSDHRKTQMRQAFRNLDAFLRAAGGSKRDLVHIYLFIRNKDDQADMLDVWLEEFPTDGDRPARKAIFDDSLVKDSKMMHLMCIAVVGKGRRLNLEAPGISKRHPAPMGCRVGNLLIASGVGGDDPQGQEKSKNTDVRSALAFQNLRALMEGAGGSLDDVNAITITVNDYADEPAILQQWRKVFPDPDNEPARHIMAFGGRGTYPVQLHALATMGGS